MKLKWILAFLLILAAGFLLKSGDPNPPAQPLIGKVAETVRAIKDPETVTIKDPSDPDETQRLLKEAANRRFKVDRPQGMLTDDPDVAEELTRQVAVEMLLDTLIREKLDKDPEYLQATEARMLSKEPRLMTLTQNDSAGDPRVVQVLVSDTRECQQLLATGSQFEVRLEDLARDFCMHPTLEYPGGFDPTRPLQLSIGPVNAKARLAEVDRQWERLLKIEMRSSVIAEFIPRYKATGALTL